MRPDHNLAIPEVLSDIIWYTFSIINKRVVSRKIRIGHLKYVQMGDLQLDA